MIMFQMIMLMNADHINDTSNGFRLLHHLVEDERRKKISVEMKKTDEEVVRKDITEKTNDTVVRCLTYGSNTFNNSDTALLNNYGGEDEVSEVSNDEEEKLVD